MSPWSTALYYVECRVLPALYTELNHKSDTLEVSHQAPIVVATVSSHTYMNKWFCSLQDSWVPPIQTVLNSYFVHGLIEYCVVMHDVY